MTEIPGQYQSRLAAYVEGGVAVAARSGGRRSRFSSLPGSDCTPRFRPRSLELRADGIYLSSEYVRLHFINVCADPWPNSRRITPGIETLPSSSRPSR